MAGRNKVPTTATSSRPAIIRCCYSIVKATAWPPSCRPSNVHSADGWEELLLPEIERQQAPGKEVAFRGDAAFAKPEPLRGAGSARRIIFDSRELLSFPFKVRCRSLRRERSDSSVAEQHFRFAVKVQFAQGRVE